MALFDNLLGRTETPEVTNDTVAAQARYQAWGIFLDREIAELQALLGAGVQQDEVYAVDMSSDAMSDAVQPLNPAGFALIEG